VSGNIVRTQAPTGDWQLTTLGEVCVLQRRRVDPDQMHPASLLEHWSIPALDEFGGPAEEPAGSIGSHKFLLAEDCVLLSLLNPRIPRHAIAAGGENVICSTEFAAMVPGAQLSLSFLNCLVSASGFVGRFVNLAQGTTKSRERVRPAEFLALQMTLPPLAEQRRIVDVVGAVDDCVEALDAQLAATRTLRGGVLAELLGSPGPDWQLTTLGEVMHHKPGRYLKKTDYVSGGPFMVYGSNSLMGSHVDFLYQGPLVVMAGIGAYAGAVRLSREPCWVNNNAFAIFGKAHVDTAWLFMWLDCMLDLDLVRRATAQPYIDKTVLVDHPIAVPPLAEQRRIVEVVGAIDEQVAALETQAEATRTVRAGVLAELLSGQRLLDESYDRAVGT